MASCNKIEPRAELDAAIRRVYEKRERGGNKALARRYNVGTSYISERAVQLGLPPLIAVVPRSAMVKWIQAELTLVRNHIGEPIAQLRIRLAKKGYNRSESSIRSLIHRQRETGNWPDGKTILEELDIYEISDLVQGLGAHNHQIQRWIQRGLLKSKGGGDHHYLIARTELRRFLLTYPAHWDHRTADRWFLLTVLAGDEAVKCATKASRQEAT